VLRRMGK